MLLSLVLNAGAAEITVTVDRRVELVSQVFRLAGAEEYTRAADTAYVRAADAWFGRCRDRAAVGAVGELRSKYGVGYDAPAKLAVHLDPRTLALMVPYERLTEVDERWAPGPTKRFVTALRRFATNCDLDGFLATEAATIGAVEARWAAQVEELDLVGWFEGVLGPAPGATWTVHPGMLVGPNNYGTSYARPDGTMAFEPVLGLGHVDEAGLPVLGPGTEQLLVHELAHAALDAHLERARAALEPAGDRAFAINAARMRAQAYGDGWTLIHETSVRAFSVLYARDRQGPEAAKAALASEVGHGFAWLPALVDALEAARGRPGGVVEVLATMGPLIEQGATAAADAPFTGPVNNVFEGPWIPDRLVVVQPVGASATRSAAYTKAVHGKLFAPKGIALAAADTFAEEGGPIGQVLYGSPTSNPQLAAMLGRLGWVVAADGVTLGANRFGGEGLVLVACAPHPDDPKLPVLVYAAADDAWIEGINGIFHGPTDWVVARRVEAGKFEVVAKGDW